MSGMYIYINMNRKSVNLRLYVKEMYVSREGVEQEQAERLQREGVGWKQKGRLQKEGMGQEKAEKLLREGLGWEQMERLLEDGAGISREATERGGRMGTNRDNGKSG